MDGETKTELVRVTESTPELPPILAGRHTPAVEVQVRSFYGSVADIFEKDFSAAGWDASCRDDDWGSDPSD